MFLLVLFVVGCETSTPFFPEGFEPYNDGIYDVLCSIVTLCRHIISASKIGFSIFCGFVTALCKGGVVMYSIGLFVGFVVGFGCKGCCKNKKNRKTESQIDNIHTKQETRGNLTCCVCLDCLPDVALPCGHCYCSNCEPNLRKRCPTCRKNTKSLIDSL